MIHNKFMTDPILYLSMILRYGEVYVLISYFHVNDDNNINDGDRFIYNF